MNKRIVKYLIIVFSFFIYLLCVSVFTSINLDHKRNEVLTTIDERLKTSAYAVYYILGEDFFKRAITRDSITLEEDWKNIRKLTSYNKHAGLAFLYAVIKRDGNIYVISSSATQDELNNNTELHYFHHYDTASEELLSIFEDHIIRVIEYQDEWGEFRGVFVPIKITDSHTVVMASEIELSYLENILNAVKQRSYGQGLLFLVFLAPFVFTISYLLKLENRELRGLLYTDNMTELPNRLFLLKYLDEFFSKHNNRQDALALINIDIDNFKEINEGFGYHVGDDVLKSIANRLRGSIGGRGILTRDAGDEFFVIISYEKKIDIVSGVAQEFIDLFVKPIEADGYHFYVSCSVGISLYPNHAQSTSELIQNALMATSKVKEDGKKGYQLFNSKINDIYNKKCELRQLINDAISNNEYYLVYQPQFNAVTNSIIGVEALLRWKHPSKGLMYPAKFIPYAENSGLIIEIEKIVLDKAISMGAEWKRAGVNNDIRIAINITPQLLYQDAFTKTVKNLMVKHGCSPDILKFEITEQVAIKNPATSIAKLKEIRNLGVEISIDDFGSGYSSLAYLKDLPVDQIKIDRSFVANLVEEERNQYIIRSIIQLCRGLSLSVIAEGAETKEEVDFLISAGCECVQGFYFSKPIESDRLFDLLSLKSIH